MEINEWYAHNFETRLSGRYVTLQHLKPLLDSNNTNCEISVEGHSELNEEIPLLKIGHGPEIILGWSQMHGNETTTTKAIFDFLKFIGQKEFFQSEITDFLSRYTFYVLPMLNPDGAKRYIRENCNSVDLNRDAQQLSQRESRVLFNLFDRLKPNLCLNFHDQRSIYGFEYGKPATVSFLSPAADAARNSTPARQVAMRHIVKMNSTLQNYIPGQVGRYDDSFNEACVGDTFQKLGVPTILFEAGHCNQDYRREKTREYIFYALLSLFNIIDKKDENLKFKEYFEIPQNLKNYNDIILRNVTVSREKGTVSIAVQYEEYLQKGRVNFRPIIDDIGDLKNKFAHRTVEISNRFILTNSQKVLTIGADISEILAKMKLSLNFFQD